MCVRTCQVNRNNMWNNCQYQISNWCSFKKYFSEWHLQEHFLHNCITTWRNLKTSLSYQYIYVYVMLTWFNPSLWWLEGLVCLPFLNFLFLFCFDLFVVIFCPGWSKSSFSSSSLMTKLVRKENLLLKYYLSDIPIDIMSNVGVHNHIYSFTGISECCQWDEWLKVQVK